VSDEPLADECVVVRGGLLEVRSLRHSVEVCATRLGFYGLSLRGENGLTFEETCRRARLRNLVVRVSTVGLLRELGHEPYRSGRSPHLTIEFDLRPTDDELRAVAGAFDPAVPNPHPAD
jgi:hypothetical protein